MSNKYYDEWCFFMFPLTSINVHASTVWETKEGILITGRP